MKPSALLISILLLNLMACSTPTTQEANTADPDSSEQTTRTVCFQRVMGQQNQDTSRVRLILRGAEVSGEFAELLYEKDARRGTLAGTKQGNLIRTIWTFSQEGTHDTLKAEFELIDNTLRQKPYSVDMVSGRQYLNDTSGYSLPYVMIDCPQ